MPKPAKSEPSEALMTKSTHNAQWNYSATITPIASISAANAGFLTLPFLITKILNKTPTRKPKNKVIKKLI